jgi:hypothetical protein
MSYLIVSFSCGCDFYEERPTECLVDDAARCQSEVCHPYDALAILATRCHNCGGPAHQPVYAWNSGRRACTEISALEAKRRKKTAELMVINPLPAYQYAAPSHLDIRRDQP